MNNYFSLLSISKCRTELMGISALLIIICHCVGFVDMPSIISYPIAACCIGVDIFLFLSGLGMYYSLSKCHSYNFKLFGWYKSRYIKLFIPYTLTALPIVICDCITSGKSFTEGFLYFTTISFWTNHYGFWFIAVLIPLYFVSPFLYLILRKSPLTISIIISILFYVLGSDMYSYYVESGDSVIYNIKYAFVRIPPFVLGMGMGKYIMENKTVKAIPLSVILLIFSVVALVITRHTVFSYIFMLLPIVFIVTKAIERFGKMPFLSFMGTVSLESYVFNVGLPEYIKMFIDKYSIYNYNNITLYLAVIVVGISLSSCFGYLSRKITKTFKV